MLPDTADSIFCDKDTSLGASEDLMGDDDMVFVSSESASTLDDIRSCLWPSMDLADAVYAIANESESSAIPSKDEPTQSAWIVQSHAVLWCETAEMKKTKRAMI